MLPPCGKLLSCQFRFQKLLTNLDKKENNNIREFTYRRV